MSGDVHVRFCERLGVRFPRATRLLLFSDAKSQLWEWKAAVRAKLAELRMTLHEGSSTVYPVTAGIPFLGVRLYPDHRRLKRRNGVAFARRLRRNYRAYAQARISRADLDRRVQGWVAHAAHADTWGLRRALLSLPLPSR